MNEAMKRRLARRAEEIAAREAAYNADVDAPREEDDPAADPEAEPGDKQDNAEEDYETRFKRVSGKMSALESENAALRRQLAEKQVDTPAKAEPSAEEREQALIEDLRKEYGDDWEYMDDVQQKMAIRQEKRLRALSVDDSVKSALSKRDDDAKTRSFITRMDEALKAHGTNFVEAVNNPAFDAWLRESRKRTAIFEAAAQGRDDEAVTDMSELFAEFLGRKGKENSTSPTVRRNKPVSPPKAGKEITFAEYAAAVKDKRHPGRRAAAQKIIDAYNKQQEG